MPNKIKLCFSDILRLPRKHSTHSTVFSVVPDYVSRMMIIPYVGIVQDMIQAYILCVSFLVYQIIFS